MWSVLSLYPNYVWKEYESGSDLSFYFLEEGGFLNEKKTFYHIAFWAALGISLAGKTGQLW